MQIALNYGDQLVGLQIPDRNHLGTLLSASKPQGISEEKILEDMLQGTLEGERTLESILADQKNLLVIVNDGTRPTPTARLLDRVAPLLKRADVRFLVATGAHRAPIISELSRIFGNSYDVFAQQIHHHNSKDSVSMRYYGTTSFGTEVAFHQMVDNSDAILIIGSVEPHYFAGFTGGRKGLLPGVASYKTIEQNHKLALSDAASTMELEDNPVHLDMMEAVGFLKNKPLYGMMAVLDDMHRVFAWEGGRLNDSFNRAKLHAQRVFGVPLIKRADIVVTVAKSPMDINLYQSQKALDNANLAVRAGGSIILIAACTEGVGDSEFAELLASSSSPEEVFSRVSKRYVLGYHKAVKMARIFGRVSVHVYSDLSDNLLESLFIKSSKDVQLTLDSEIVRLGPDSQVLFMPDGGMTVPMVGLL